MGDATIETSQAQICHDVMTLVCHGMTSVEIGAQLAMPATAVDTRVDAEMARFGARSRAQVAAMYVKYVRTVEDHRNIDRLPRISSIAEASTPRLRDVLLLVSEGLTNAQIGERLKISSATAKLHVHTASARIYAKNRVHAAAIYANAMFGQSGQIKKLSPGNMRDTNRRVRNMRSLEKHQRMLVRLREEGFDWLDIGVIHGTRIGFIKGKAGLVLGVSPLALATNEN